MNSLFPDYEDLCLEDFQPRDASQRDALKAVQDYMDNLPEVRKLGLGLTFLGPAGLGKTYLAEMVIKQAAQERYSIESLEASTLVQMHQKLYGRLGGAVCLA